MNKFYIDFNGRFGTWDEAGIVYSDDEFHGV